MEKKKAKRNFAQEASDFLTKYGWFQVQNTAKSSTAEYSVWAKRGSEHKHLTLVVYGDAGWEVFAGFNGADFNEQMDSFIGAN